MVSVPRGRMKLKLKLEVEVQVEVEREMKAVIRTSNRHTAVYSYAEKSFWPSLDLPSPVFFAE